MACGYTPCSCDRDEAGILAFFANLGFPLEPWMPPPDSDERLRDHRWKAACFAFHPVLQAEPSDVSPVELWACWHRSQRFADVAFREYRLEAYKQRYRDGDETYRAAVDAAVHRTRPLPGLSRLYGVQFRHGCFVEHLSWMSPWTLAGAGELTAFEYIRHGLKRWTPEIHQRLLALRLPREKAATKRVGRL